MPLYFFYTMVQKSQKWPKTQIKGGPALIVQKWRFYQALFPTVIDPVAMRAWVRGYDKCELTAAVVS